MPEFLVDIYGKNCEKWIIFAQFATKNIEYSFLVHSV